MAKKDGKSDQNKNFEKKMQERGKNKPGPKQSSNDQVQIVRLLSTDLDGRKSISTGLRKIKGISFQMSNIILKKTQIPPSTKVGDLTDEQTSLIETAVKDPHSMNIPPHFLNVRRFVEDDESQHLTGSELDLFLRNHISDLKKLGSYIGIRHRTGKRVRGQRTRSSGRGKGKTVGVSKRRG